MPASNTLVSNRHVWSLSMGSFKDWQEVSITNKHQPRQLCWASFAIVRLYLLFARHVCQAVAGIGRMGVRNLWTTFEPPSMGHLVCIRFLALPTHLLCRILFLYCVTHFLPETFPWGVAIVGLHLLWCDALTILSPAGRLLYAVRRHLS